MTLAENPFFVLGLSVETSRIEIEREAQKLLGMLDLGFAAVKFYATPLGPRERTAEAVRAAVAALRDPSRRLVAEVWARHAPAPIETAPQPTPAAPAEVHEGARRTFGWRP
ncbi:hypothetical protein BH11MYX1_BH11MYX1_27360 [soil metagenome]